MSAGNRLIAGFQLTDVWPVSECTSKLPVNFWDYCVSTQITDRERWDNCGLFCRGCQGILSTLSWRRPLLYRNQSIDLLHKSIYWFLYDNGLRHERIKSDHDFFRYIYLWYLLKKNCKNITLFINLKKHLQRL